MHLKLGRHYCGKCHHGFGAKLRALDEAAIRSGTTTRAGGGTGPSALAVQVANRPQSVTGRPQASSIQGILKTATVAADGVTQGEQAEEPKELSNAELQRQLTRLEKKL